MVAISILMVGSTSPSLNVLFSLISCGGPRFIGWDWGCFFSKKKTWKRQRIEDLLSNFLSLAPFWHWPMLFVGQSWQLCPLPKEALPHVLDHHSAWEDMIHSRMEVERNRPRFPRDRTILITLSRAMHPYHWQMIGFWNCSCCSIATGFRSVLFTIFCWFPFRSSPSPQNFVQHVFFSTVIHWWVAKNLVHSG